MTDILVALWFMIPAGVANVTPVFFAKVPLINRWNTPIDFGSSYSGKRILGNNKTWRGMAIGVSAGTAALYGQVWLLENCDKFAIIAEQLSYDNVPILLLGLALSFGALGGDALESFFKRQKGVASGDAWFPFDQLDYIAGAVLLSMPIMLLTLTQYIWIFVLWFGIHLLSSYVGFLIKLKDKPI